MKKEEKNLALQNETQTEKEDENIENKEEANLLRIKTGSSKITLTFLKSVPAT